MHNAADKKAGSERNPTDDFIESPMLECLAYGEGVAVISQAKLDSFLGKSMSQICPNGYADPNDNHCAHFVSHVLGFRFGLTCGQMKTGPGPSVNIRVQEVFSKCPAVNAWSQKPIVLISCLVFITNSSNVDLTNRVMTNVPRKHVGIYSNGSIIHYSNSKHSVVSQTPDEFSNHYPAPSNSMFWGRMPPVFLWSPG